MQLEQEQVAPKRVDLAQGLSVALVELDPLEFQQELEFPAGINPIAWSAASGVRTCPCGGAGVPSGCVGVATTAGVPGTLGSAGAATCCAGSAGGCAVGSTGGVGSPGGSPAPVGSTAD